MDKRDLKVHARAGGLFYGWVVIAACFVTVFTFMASYYTFGVFFKPISGEFGWNRGQTSLAVAINMMTGGLVAILAGRLADRYKPGHIMLVCSLLAGLTYVVMSKITSLGQLYLLYGVVLGVSMSAHYVVPSLLINRWFLKKRGLGLGIVFSAFGMAQVISPPVTAYLIESVGWRDLYIYIGAFMFLAGATSALFMRGSPREMGLLPDGEPAREKPEAKENKIQTGMSAGETMRSSTFWLISVLWFFSAFPVYIMVIHLIPYSTDMGINVMAAASILTASGVANIIGRISMGHLSDRFGSKFVLLLSYVAVIAGMLLLINARSLLNFYVAVVLISIFVNGADTVVIRSLGDLFGLKALGFIVGVTSLLWRGGAAAGAYLAGVFFDLSGSYAITFSLAAVAMYVCFILTMIIFKKKTPMKATAG